MNKRKWLKSWVVLLLVAVFAIGIGFLHNSKDSRLLLSAVGDGTAASPYEIGSFNDFSNYVADMARPGTAANPTYFKITAPIDMGGLNPTFTRTLANHIIIDGQGYELSNLNSSLFSRVVGPNSVIKNINFIGTGNIAHEFSGIMDNVHHVEGSVFNLNGTSVGGLVNFSENATFRYCSNAATIRRSTAESSVVSNGGIIGVAFGSLYMTNTSNSGIILTMGTVESSGGLIGKVATSGTALIELSYNTGIVNGQRSGGLVGKMDGTGTLEIKESYNTGRISNRDATLNSTATPSAGILAWATGGTVNIGSSYNKGNVRIGTDVNETTTRSAYSAGIFGLNEGATVSIERTYNTGIAYYAIAVNTSSGVANNFVLSGTYTTLGTVTLLTQTQLRNASTVAALNTELEFPVYRQATSTNENDGYPVHVGEAYRFNANGGIMTVGNEPVDSIRFSQAELQDEKDGTGSIGAITLENFAYDFVGWSTNAQAQPSEQVFYDYWDALTTGGGTYYAVWRAVEYKINFELSEGFTDRQTYEANYMNGDASRNGLDWVFVIGQNIYFQTWINSAVNNDYFVDWEIKLPGAADFTSFSQGFRPALSVNPGVLSERLDFYVNNISIIDEQFIRTLVTEESKSITIRALFRSGTTYELFVDATTSIEGDRQTPSHTYRSWGAIKINGSVNSIPKEERFEGTGTYTISAKPNNHYRFVQFEIVPASDTSQVTIIDTLIPDANGYYSFEETFNEDYHVYAIFEPVIYNIVVTAKTTNSLGVDSLVPPSDASGLVMKNGFAYDGSQMEIKLNDVFNGVSLGSNDNYKLVNSTLNNFKLMNKKTGAYDYRSTNSGGEINIQINSAFLENYLISGNIELVAMFVELVELEVEIETPELGTVSIDVRDGASHYSNREVTAFKDKFGIESSVTINLEYNYQVFVKSISIFDESNNEQALSTKQQTIRFNLDSARRVVIKYEILAYSMEIFAVDSDRNRVTEYELPRLDITLNGSHWENEGLGLGNTVEVTKQVNSEWDDEWDFLGWFLIYDDNQEFELYGNPLDELNLVGDNAVVINGDFIRDYLSSSVHFIIEARFAKIFNVTIAVGMESSGGVKSVSGENLVGLTKQSVNNQLVIRLEPAKYYSIAKVDGLIDDESIQYDDDGAYVLINITEERNIHVTYQPDQTDVVNLFSNSDGKVTINREQIGIGTTVVIHFKPKTGYQLDNWTINGVSVDKIKAEYTGSNASVSGNMVSFKITYNWYDEFGSKLESDIKVVLNTFLVAGIVGIAIIVPLLLIGTILMMRANKKRKAEYAVALRKTKEAKARMGFVDSIKSARGE